ncbi:YsnF/AvaK domain-containing protein [Micromonospora sp. GCM10011542]|uniref:YsnF/AvaK domain-containing protein n=1 Tax=Micromonospora sp. GCM10011542 TaxID=3317337 RepID=UPI00361C9B99
MRLNDQQIRSLYGQDVQDRSGAKIGSVGQVWADTAGFPAWVSVKTGVMGHHESMAPLGNARMQDGRLMVAYDKATVKGAPTVETDADTPLNAEQTAQLYAHYKLQPQQAPQQAPQRARQGREDLVRSEERLRVGTESQPAGTAVLRKYVVTEDVHTTVPVEHDEVYVEREPVTSADARADIGEAQQEMQLRAERPVVAKDQVPVERVHLAKNEVVEDQPVDERVRHEEVEARIPEPSRRRR